MQAYFDKDHQVFSALPWIILRSYLSQKNFIISD